MEKLGNNIMISEKSLVSTIKSFLQNDTTMVDGWKSPFSNDEHWDNVKNDSEKLGKLIIREIKFQNGLV
tara:strand:- start:41 stop:247 length:207 start_codon:yes stop_codon:yes gene_type:complete